MDGNCREWLSQRGNRHAVQSRCRKGVGDDNFALYPIHRVEGDIEVTRREGAPRKQWDHQRLTKDVTKRLMDKSIDYDTGEILMNTEEIIKAMFQYGHVDYWRVKELKKIGLNADKYSKLGDPKVSVAISRKGGKG